MGVRTLGDKRGVVRRYRDWLPEIPEEAIVAYERALERDPNSQEAESRLEELRG